MIIFTHSSCLYPLSIYKFSKYIEHTASGFMFELSFMFLLTFVTAVYLVSLFTSREKFAVTSIHLQMWFRSVFITVFKKTFLFFPSSLPTCLPSLFPLDSNLENEQVKKDQNKNTLNPTNFHDLCIKFRLLTLLFWGCPSIYLDFPGGSDGKASVYNAVDPGSIPGSGRSPGEGNGNPLQDYCLENPMDRGAW